MCMLSFSADFSVMEKTWGVAQTSSVSKSILESVPCVQ